jgi:hypothetical protein
MVNIINYDTKTRDYRGILLNSLKDHECVRFLIKDLGIDRLITKDPDDYISFFRELSELELVNEYGKLKVKRDDYWIYASMSYPSDRNTYAGKIMFWLRNFDDKTSAKTNFLTGVSEGFIKQFSMPVSAKISLRRDDYGRLVFIFYCSGYDFEKKALAKMLHKVIVSLIGIINKDDPFYKKYSARFFYKSDSATYRQIMDGSHFNYTGFSADTKNQLVYEGRKDKFMI